MMILQVNQLSKSFGADTILNNIKLEVRNRDRIAIVGRNGAGKSTLLKIIAGQLSYEKGEIIKPKDITMGYLAQHTGLDSKLACGYCRAQHFARPGDRPLGELHESGSARRGCQQSLFRKPAPA